MLNSEPPSLSWGRAAATRFAKSQEEIKADIIKALEGKLSVEFQDYSQWQRISVSDSSSQPSSKTTLKPKSKPSATSSRPVTGTSYTSSCSSLCLHPWNKKEPPPDLTAVTEQNQRIIILKARITAKKVSKSEYAKLKKLLQKENQALKNEIIGMETTTHTDVTELLERFEKYNSASTVMSYKHVDELEEATNDYQKVYGMIAEEMSKLENEVDGLDSKLQSFLQDLATLSTYKDKEYPVKTLRIAKLQNYVTNFSHEHQSEQDDLERIITGERQKMASNHAANVTAILSSAANTAFKAKPRVVLQETAQHNVVLAQEIEQNKQAIKNIELEIAQLTEEVTQLKNMRKFHGRSHIFPETFPSTDKCHPDDDVILDIPVDEHLPI